MSLVSLPAHAAHIEETMMLKNGWNAIYLESTPTNALCDAFFEGAPVERVASYQSDAYSSTRQIADDGSTIDQKPLSYRVWVPGDETASTLTALRGGCVYLIYAKDVWTTTFLGVPAAPRQTWRATSGETGFMNLVGVSADTNASMTAKAYFGEGPFGTANGIAYQIKGTKESEPTFSKFLNARVTMQGGKAYALTATKDGDWPGVVGVQGDGVVFGTDANYASITVRNCGTTNHVFKFSISASADETESVPPLMRRLPRIDAISVPGYTNVTDEAWTVELAAGEHTDQVFSLDRSLLDEGKKYGAILAIEDLGASKMRVRVPVVAAVGSSDVVAYPVGLWAGEIALSRVSGINDTNAIPVQAGGTLKMNVMLHVDTNGVCRLLQRAALGIDTNGTARLFKESSSVPAEVENPRRLSTVMMSVDTPVVAAADGSAFGDAAGFSWTVDAKARDNPFRHAWHPDHDGKKADYSGDAPSGDDIGNYVQPIKPELWSIVNRLDFSWHEQGNRALPVHFPYNADETTSGIVTWEVRGLSAKGPIKSVGTFTLKRVFKAARIEE
jgi:hypothetical protein